MAAPAGQKGHKTSLGFTLVELLLTVALVLLLLGAAVFSFTSLQRGTGLSEGATQVEALLRFARAQSASTGRRVQIQFEEDVGDGLIVPLGNLRALWEPDPLGLPDSFVELPEAATYVRGILELVSVEDVRPLAADGSELVDAMAGQTGVSGDETALWMFPPISFYPDGSSDSAEIVLASRDEEDQRRLAIRLVGVTGAIRREWLSEEPNQALTPVEPKPVAPKNPEPAGTGLE